MHEQSISNKHECPLALRLAGLWLIWCAWTSAAGWILSAMGALNGTGYLLAAPILIGAGIIWWRHTRSSGPRAGWKCRGFRWGRRRWLADCFKLLAGLSLVAAVVHLPWSFDAVTYRLPRCLYWLAEGRWYWIGTLDGRLDYSSCGLEWQMIPVLLLTKTDRCLFLLSFVPFLLLPGLTYLSGRALGLARRPLVIWMWLLPAAYCIVLQCSGIQNDGYTASYTTACLAFAGVAIRRRDPLACLFAVLAASLLTGAKLSNLPLMLPLGVVLLVAAWRSGFFRRSAAVGLSVAVLVSFLPLAVLSYRHTGTWTGDPHDQWGFRTGNPVAATVANLILAAHDLTHPPVMVGTAAANDAIERIEAHFTPFLDWLRESHRMFHGVMFGDMVYEGGSGPGFPIGCFLGGGILMGCFVTTSNRPVARAWWQTAMVGCGIIAWLVMLSQLGSGQSARNAAPYIPLLLFPLTGIPPLGRFLHSKAAVPVALCGMLSAVPVIVLTPARPLVPMGLLDKARSVKPINGPMTQILRKYGMWKGLRDDLKPLRDHLPPGESVIGYAGAFRDTSYGLWKPLGSRTLREIELPGTEASSAGAIPAYVVATARGIQQRCGLALADWLRKEHKEIRYTFKRSVNLEADSQTQYDEWYLLGPAAGQPAR